MSVILEDTRNKPSKNAHIRKQLEDLGYTVIRQGLNCGDYTWALDQHITIDTKANMNEVESNLIHDHERFRNECIRAQQLGAKLVILVQDPKLKSVDDVFGWYNIRKKWSPKAASGVQLAKMMLSMEKKYGVKWEFTSRDNLGKRIVELLGGNENGV